MSERAINKISEGFALLLLMLPFAFWCVHTKDADTTIMLAVLWALPILIYCFDWFLITLSHNGKGQLVTNRVGHSKFLISRPSLFLLLFTWSLIAVLLSHYHILSPEKLENMIHNSSIVGLIGLIALFVVFAIANIYILCGFVIVRRTPPDIVAQKPSADYNKLSSEGRCLMDSLDCFSSVIKEQKNETGVIQSLHIPEYDANVKDSKAPFMDYLNELSSIPKSHPEFASLEQFFLMVADNSGVSELMDAVGANLQGLAKDGVQYAKGLKDVLLDTKDAVVDFAHHQDTETWHKLLDNIAESIKEDVHRPYFRYRFSHASGENGKLSFLVKHLFQDMGKGTFKTFSDESSIQMLNEDFLQSFSEHIDDISSSLPTDVEMDIWDPDFDGSAHFPIITTAIEAVKLGDKYLDGTVDMEKAFEKSATKVGLTAGGAYVGSIIGSFICPGAGTAIGAMLGSWLGRKGAREINTSDLKDLQKEFSEQHQHLQQRVEEAKNNIELYQRQTNEDIAKIVGRESLRFEDLKNDNPIKRYDESTSYKVVSIIVRDYLNSIIEVQKNQVSDNNLSKLKAYIPSSEQISLYPKESLTLMLSSQEYINQNLPTDSYCNFDVINEVCLSKVVTDISLIETMQTVWYNQVYNEYKNAISTILVDSNNSIEEYVKLVQQEKLLIDSEVTKVEEIKKKVEAEAKTL